MLLKLALKEALVLPTVLALTCLVLTVFIEGTRIEAIFSPFVSLATLAFLAVFKVLIRDFFWIDIASSTRVFCCLVKDGKPSASSLPKKETAGRPAFSFPTHEESITYECEE